MGFNPRSREGANINVVVRSYGGWVSIRAPVRERTRYRIGRNRPVWLFQSALP